MTGCEDLICEYVSRVEFFTLTDIIGLAREKGIAVTAVNWTVRKLVQEGKLARTGRGVYTSRVLQSFINAPDSDLMGFSAKMAELYPSVTCCFYKGSILAPLLHHLSYNEMTYIEVEREFTEIIFHRMRDEGRKVYLKPSTEMVRDYIDMSGGGIIIKPLVSGSPLVSEDGVPMPALEKLLVDVLCDADFSYLRGGEWLYMMDNAFSTFSINVSRLFRYAGRRGKKAEITEAIKTLNYDKQGMFHPAMDRSCP
jgi:hypothetical protein